MNLALARLALRRSLPPGIAVAALVLAAWLAAADWAPPRELLELAERSQAAAAGAERALARQGIWSVLLLALAPLLTVRAAATVPRWRRGEAEWLGASSTGRGAIALSAWAGGVAAAVLALAGAALAAEVGAGTARAPGLRLAAVLPAPRAVLLDGSREVRWSVELPEGLRESSYLQAHLVPLAGSSAVGRFGARAPGGPSTAGSARVAARTALRIPLPPGAGRELELELERTSPGAALALVGEGIELVEPVASDRLASLAIAIRACLALAAWLALAFGAGAWMSTASASLLVLALSLPAWFGEGWAAQAWWPWRELPRAVALAGRGLAPGDLDPRSVAGCAAAVALGLALARAGLRSWRHGS